MKRTFLLLGVLFCAALAYPQEKAAPAPSRACSAADETSLRKVAELWKDSYNKGDAAGVAALYAEDAYYLTQHFITGILHGRARIQAYVQRGVDARYQVDSIEVISLDCSGDFAYTVGQYRSTNAGQKALGVNIVVLKKIVGKWLIVAHESAVPDPATAIQSLDSPKAP
jgi:ketosteroid isomerase-like protein